MEDAHQQSNTLNEADDRAAAMPVAPDRVKQRRSRTTSRVRIAAIAVAAVALLLSAAPPRSPGGRDCPDVSGNAGCTEKTRRRVEQMTEHDRIASRRRTRSATPRSARARGRSPRRRTVPGHRNTRRDACAPARPGRRTSGSDRQPGEQVARLFSGFRVAEYVVAAGDQLMVEAKSRWPRVAAYGIVAEINPNTIPPTMPTASAPNTFRP